MPYSAQEETQPDAQVATAGAILVPYARFDAAQRCDAGRMKEMLTHSFFNDYSEGAHPRILDVLVRTNLDQEDGYGNDTLCARAAGLIRKAAGAPDADVHFVSGGTQANLICLNSMLRSYDSVIAVESGHIYVHETGAIEATGHKVHALPTKDGTIMPEQVQALVDAHTDEHMVHPRALFISNSTEVGTIYRKADLEALSAVCRRNGLYLYLDGARLGSALTSRESDVTLADLARLVDMFYIGGTKNGALLGEAIVIPRPELKENFRFHMKQRGALLAKGRLIGAQFAAFFEDGLYFDLARRANAMAERLARGVAALGFGFLTQSPTNQIFPIFPDPLIAELRKSYGFHVWSRTDAAHSAIRLVTSWATKEENVDGFLTTLSALTK